MANSPTDAPNTPENTDKSVGIVIDETNSEPVNEQLIEQLHSGWERLLQALASPEFYIEMLIIAGCVGAALLLGMLAMRYAKRWSAARPNHTLPPRYITRTARMVSPLLSILFLSIARAPTQSVLHDGAPWVEMAGTLSIAWFLAKLVLITVQTRFIAWFIVLVIIANSLLAVTGLLMPVQAALEAMAFQLGDFKVSMLGILKGLVMFVIVFWLAGAVIRILTRYLGRATSLSYNARELISKFVKIFIYFVAFIITLSAVGVDLTAFAVFGGALGVGIGLGLQQITSNFVSGVTILMEKSIKIGDIVEIEGNMGWVRQLNMRYTLLETFDGRELMIPNEQLVTNRVTNWTYSTDRARVEINIGVAYDTDMELAQRIMLECAKENARCLEDPAPFCVMREFGDSSVNFLLAFWVGDVREGRYGPQNDVMMAIFKRFGAEGIEIPFPQRVVHMVGNQKPEEDV